MAKVPTSPPKVNKGKGVAVAGLSRRADEDDGAAVKAAQRFMRWQAGRSVPTTAASSSFPVEVLSSLEGLDPRFRLDILAAARVKARDEEFRRMGVSPRKTFNPVPNVINTKSILFDDSDVGCCMLEAMMLPRDRHVMCHTEDTTKEFAMKLSKSFGLVSHLTWF